MANEEKIEHLILQNLVPRRRVVAHPRGPPFSSRNRSKNSPLFEVHSVSKRQFNLKMAVDCCFALRR
jgi:hypothetical protein